MSYRPITDVWILARSKVKYFGAYPAGFLSRARDLLAVSDQDQVLHVCAGKVRDYPFRGFGPNDITMDLDQELNPTFTADASKAQSYKDVIDLHPPNPSRPRRPSVHSRILRLLPPRSRSFRFRRRVS